jgi:hypothetical protein
MKYIKFFILFILIVSVSQTVRAQDERYRVELLVLKHLNHAEEPREMKWIEDYSSATDFLTPEPPPEELPEGCEPEAEPADADSAESMGQTLDGQVPDTQSLDGQSTGDNPLEPLASEQEMTPEKDPNALIHRVEMSDSMQEAWRRLRLSAPFRPEQYLSWEQGSNEPFPRLRLHDLEVVDIDDPHARERFERERAEAEAAAAEEEASGSAREGADTLVFSDSDASNDPCREADDTAEDSAPGLPDPTLFYRLDGAVMLKRSRFLHLELDLQLREAVHDDAALSAAAGNLLAQDPATESEPGPPQPWALPSDEEAELFVEPVRPSAFLIHALKQSRQVKTERMEYFDSPVLGVLALITRVEDDEAAGAESP